MMALEFSEASKNRFFEAFLVYRTAGEDFHGAYLRARADFNAAHRLAPNLWTFHKWYTERMRGKDRKAK